MSYNYTTLDFINAIEREQAKRATTYPKIIQKMRKNEVDILKIGHEIGKQGLQNQRLSVVLGALKTGVCESHIAVGYMELEREYKMRLKCYPRFVMFKRMDTETAHYEIGVWKEITIYFAETFLGDIQIALEALETKPRKRKSHE